jgi:hypothetical protein
MVFGLSLGPHRHQRQRGLGAKPPPVATASQTLTIAVVWPLIYVFLLFCGPLICELSNFIFIYPDFPQNKIEDVVGCTIIRKRTVS